MAYEEIRHSKSLLLECCFGAKHSINFFHSHSCLFDSFPIVYLLSQLQEKVEQEFLGKQTEHIKKLADVIRRLELYEEADYPLGEYVTDLHLDS